MLRKGERNLYDLPASLISNKVFNNSSNSKQDSSFFFLRNTSFSHISHDTVHKNQILLLLIHSHFGSAGEVEKQARRFRLSSPTEMRSEGMAKQGYKGSNVTLRGTHFLWAACWIPEWLRNLNRPVSHLWMPFCSRRYINFVWREMGFPGLAGSGMGSFKQCFETLIFQ